MPTESLVQVTGYPRIKWWAFAPFALLALVHLYALAAGNPKLASNTQSFLMIVLLFGYLLATPSGMCLAKLLGSLALLGSALGDNSDLGGAQFLQGLAAFAFAHLAYLALFIWGLKFRMRSIRLWAFGYLPLLGLVLFLVLPHAGSMQLPVIIYACLILLMAAVGTAGNRAIAFGAILFVISDAILSLTLFIPDFHFWQSDLAIMFCYTIGQGLIICGATAWLWQREKRTSHSSLEEKMSKN